MVLRGTPVNLLNIRSDVYSHRKESALKHQKYFLLFRVFIEYVFKGITLYIPKPCKICFVLLYKLCIQKYIDYLVRVLFFFQSFHQLVSL